MASKRHFVLSVLSTMLSILSLEAREGQVFRQEDKLKSFSPIHLHAWLSSAICDYKIGSFKKTKD